MSFREVDPDLVKIILELQKDISELQAGLGKTRQNTVRLGDYVLEAESDEHVKMTNVRTGDVSYVGWQTINVYL